MVTSCAYIGTFLSCFQVSFRNPAILRSGRVLQYARRGSCTQGFTGHAGRMSESNHNPLLAEFSNQQVNRCIDCGDLHLLFRFYRGNDCLYRGGSFACPRWPVNKATSGVLVIWRSELV